MNKAIYSGNICKEIELTYTPGTGTAVVRNTIACRRKIKNKDTGKYDSDFIPIVAFGKTAEFIAQHFIKGQGIEIETHMQSGSYEDKNGNKRYTLDAIVDGVEFPKSNGNNQGSSNNFGSNEPNFDMDMTPVDDGDIPF
jgi:single-strand DNA-binding protein